MIINLSGLHLPSNLSGPVLVDRHGLPRYWAAVWSAATTGALADSTHTKKLRYIDSLYRHADELRGPGALDDALGTLSDGVLAELLESWFISIRNQSQVSEADETRWQVGLNFVTSVVSWIAKSDSHKKLRTIESRLHQLSVLYSQFRVKKRNPQRRPAHCLRQRLRRYITYSTQSQKVTRSPVVQRGGASMSHLSLCSIRAYAVERLCYFQLTL